MTDVARATYLRLMQEIEDLEDQVETLKATTAPTDPRQHAAALQKAAAELDEKRRELARLSDGCGRPHHR
jgi:cell division septum initiation protein DivIVA